MHRPLLLAPALLHLCAAPCLVAQSATLHIQIEVLESGRAANNASNAVVWLEPRGDSPPIPAPQTVIPKLAQRNKQFHPPLVVVPVGGKVEFPNQDPFFHNVFSLFDGKRFDLGLYEGGTTRFVYFDKPGISYIFCNIHAQMSAVVLTLDTPYFGVSDVKGGIVLAGVPAGRYRMRVFHASVSAEDLEQLSREITVSPGINTLGAMQLHSSNVLASHKNKYGRDYDQPVEDYPRPY